ncbi:MAG: hypothetical protein FWC16_14110 [Defluviitaleaceae bacterium]|nr:hypothetical protein [Defluviitaleaceae bacterium]MCL2276047.1 hypothetical protein [Defluviitaleaceae bacterium]
MYTESAWVRFLRILLVIQLLFWLVVGFISGFLGFLLCAFIGVFLLVLGMTIAEMAEGVRQNREILDRLKQASGATAATVVQCKKCEKHYDTGYNSCPECGYRGDAPKPSLANIAANIAEGWICVCEEKNPRAQVLCRSCGKRR